MIPFKIKELSFMQQGHRYNKFFTINDGIRKKKYFLKNTGSTGNATETRPENIAFLHCIKG